MYQVLARKYRPRNFNELVGQNHVSRALTSALERGRLHHAYLFTGTRGVGKTTIARILAKCLNCETGVTSTPCEVCPTCQSVNEGRFIDLIEIDAASRTKVEDTRELLDNVPYAPTQGRFKVYLIDEVHMLSTHSFNALLKTLEEPPEHVKFLFATTDPQKLPITVISRCLQFTLRPLAVDEITTHLTDILGKEDIQAEQDALWQIAESAQGSLRDALSLTDQAIAYGQGAIQHQDVKEMLGLIDRTIIYDLILAIHQNQKQRVSDLLIQFRQQALDVSLVLDQFISTLHELALLQYLPDLSLKYSAEINQKIMQLSQLVSAQDLQLYYQIACKGRADLQLAVTQEQGFEMCVLRLLAFRPLQPNEVVVTQQHASPQQNTIGVQAPLKSQQETVHQAIPPQQVTQPLAVQQDVAEYVAEKIIENSVQIEALHTAETKDEHQIEDQVANLPQTEQIVFDPSTGDALFGLDESEAEESAVQVDEPSSDDFLEDDFSLSNFDDHPVQQVVNTVNEIDQHSEMTVETLEPSIAQVEITEVVEESESVEKTSLMPQDILRLQDQSLDGEWTVEKWEFWFRNSGLSPAVQELAQYGVMQGHINGESIFHIPEQYQHLLTQMQGNLENALKEQWSNTLFKVQYGEVSGMTPFTMQHARKDRAFQRTVELLNEEPIIKDLMKSFDGELQNIQIKS
ncbi:DNA polymerase III subunit gamma/tau [Acinetobacter sp. Ac_877]|uniref:DNA polymerase III subunit gamma/tau n=1 Tax=Acinetobacter portensis TaxID=1839785 RepID=UPI00128C052C|nr:DNA polymerase III subunit gamma/tau [Acinetobacter portensis]MPW42629.1 DNA polymerase III subunit gamma/tau [Acinetobacter portensis]